MEIVDRRLGRPGCPRLIACASIPLRRCSGVSGRLEMTRHQSGKFTGPLSALLDQPGRGLGVVIASVGFEHAFVDHAPQQGMSEGVLGGACKRRSLASEDQLLLAKRLQGLQRGGLRQVRSRFVWSRSEGFERVGPKNSPQYGGPLQQRSFSPGETVQTRLQQSRQRCRDSYTG